MFETNNISIEESYILKRVLRGFRQLRSLILWKVCDDAMLQILGVTCHHLVDVDIWKSTAATDTGVRMFLGLDAERPFKVFILKLTANKVYLTVDHTFLNEVWFQCNAIQWIEKSCNKKHDLSEKKLNTMPLL